MSRSELLSPPTVTPTHARLLWSVALALLFVLVSGLPASAHTGLESSSPAADEVVPESPPSLVLTFTKPVKLLGDSVVLVASNGGSSPVERTSLSQDGLAVTAELADDLATGPWTVRWRVLASDSHPREGEYAFTVGGPEPAVAPDAESTGPSEGATGKNARPTGSSALPAQPRLGRAFFELLGGAARIVFYLGLMTAAGLALFKAGPHRGEASRAARLAHVAALAAGTALAASAVEVVSHVAAVSGLGLRGVADTGTWRAVLSTGLGTAFAVRSVGLALLLAGATRRFRLGLPSGPDVLKLSGAAIAIASFQFVGHTASAAPAWIVRSADAVHAVAAAVWIGGLVGLVLISRSKGDPDAGMRTAWRFSSIASIAVAAVAVAGTALAWVNIPDLASIFTTGYGQVLMAKLVLVGALAALGAHNHFRVVPRFERGEVAALAQLKRTVRAEVAIVVIVIALTALLVNLSPA